MTTYLLDEPLPPAGGDVRARRKIADLTHAARSCRETPGGWVVQWPMETTWQFWRRDGDYAVKIAAGTLESCLAAARLSESE